jgi:prepilin-type N-terminal cleavage/methylation domain-containing protein
MESSATTQGNRRGFTLLELLAVVSLLGLVLSQALPLARAQVDRLAVVGAREKLAGLLHEARASAVTYGGARVRVVRSPPSAELLVGEEVHATVAFGRGRGTRLSLSRDRAEVEIRYDALGLGRVASQTVRFTRGEVGAALVISSYGRIRRE